MAPQYTSIFILAIAFGITNAQLLTSDQCLEPLLAATHLTMCEQMNGFSQCYIDSTVPHDDISTLTNILDALSESFYFFKQEQCDLNAEFNNECTDEFVDCLDYVYALGQPFDCSAASYNSFLQCTRQQVPNAWGRCYFSSWVEMAVNRTRAIQCVGTPATQSHGAQDDTGDVVSPVNNVNNNQNSGSTDFATGNTQNSGSANFVTGNNQNSDSASINQNSGSVNLSTRNVDFPTSCDAPSGLRFHVSADCTQYQLEWVSQGIRYPVQDVAPGTLFDVNICGQNHEGLVPC